MLPVAAGTGISCNSQLMGWRRKKEEGRHPSVSGGGEGYSRVVRINDPDYNSTNEYDEAAAALALAGEDYPSNGISTTKYTVANFIPKSLFEQFRRVANLFFLIVACVSFSPLAPYRAVSVIFPLLVVVGATMAKEAVEDLRRKQQDIEINNRKVKVFDRNRASFNITQWKKLRVGDIVQVNKDEFFPADLLLLSSSNADHICYVETMNLDGETNLKRKQCLKITSALRTEVSLKNFKGYIKCEDPNDKLYSFLGTLHHQGIQYPISPHSILLRDSKLRNTHHVYGVVIFTGHDTKVMQNATAPPSKRSKVEMKMDKIIYILFTSLVVLSTVGSIFFGIKTRGDISSGEQQHRWYLRPDESSALFDPRRAVLASVFHFLTALMLFGSLIPISLYISIEIVKVLQSTFINQDREMYSEELNQPARARTSNLNEELGQVSTILSDKTGTLTCNSMEFVKCSIAGVDYGSSLSEVEIHVERGTNGGLPFTLKGENDANGSKNSVKGFNLKDDRLMHGKWVNAPHPDVIQMFFRVLAICHTAIPVLNDKSDDILYEAESPDEAAFVIAARELGFEFYSRKHACILLHEFDPDVGRKVDRAYELLNILEFSSSRKRMSVIIRTEDNQLLLLCKGADSVIFDKLAKEKQTFEAATRTHIRRYSEAGLRTITVAYRTITEEEYRIWYDEFSAATNAVTAEHDVLVEAAAEKIEKDLILIGATAVEDRLQKGVPECINKLSQAGIRIWVLTGDKLETAVNIGFACHLLRQDMKQIIISLDALDVDAVTAGDKKTSEMVSYECITRQLREARAQVCLSNGSSTPYALIIDGNSLAFALSSSLEKSFFAIAVNCASVLCCRTSPKQKALVTRLVKKNTSKTTLAIGDGANDVGMLQEADVGIGISGAEGMQAVMSSDFSIAQFRFLERLLLVHGHWCYRRITSMICYFFYKNITFGITLFCFEAHASFSAQPAYNDWFLSLYSVAFTSLPVIALGVFDKDLSSRACLKFPLLHQDGVLNIFFSWRRILGWMLNGAYSSIIIFYLTSSSIFEQSFRRGGRVAGLDILGLTMYGCVVWTVNCQMALYLSYFTWIQHLVIWGSIAFWYVFAAVYGLFPPLISTSAYMVFLEAACESPLYWLATLLVVVSAILPFFVFSVVQTSFFPKYHDLVRTEGLRNR